MKRPSILALSGLHKTPRRHRPHSLPEMGPRFLESDFFSLGLLRSCCFVRLLDVSHCLMGEICMHLLEKKSFIVGGRAFGGSALASSGRGAMARLALLVIWVWGAAVAVVLDFDSAPSSGTAAFDAAAGVTTDDGPGAFSILAGSSAGGKLPSWKLPIKHCDDAAQSQCRLRSGRFVGESWSEKKSRSVDNGKGIAVIGSSRLFYAQGGEEGLTPKQWRDVEYEKLFLVDKSLSFTIDLSDVPCGCNAAVCMPPTPATQNCA
jgi:hypothetical protein